MARPSSVVSRIMPALMLFIEQGRKLPATNQGKVNVAALCKELHEIDSHVKKSGDAQHFHTKAELKDLVNTLATEQDLLPIGHGAPTGEIEEIEQRLHTAAKQAKEDAQAAIEATAAQGALIDELKVVRAELELTKLELKSTRERLRYIEEGGFLFPPTD